MPPLATQPALRNIDLSKLDGPTNATVVVVPLPKKTVGIIFGVGSLIFRSLYSSLMTVSLLGSLATHCAISPALQHLYPRHQQCCSRPSGRLGCPVWQQPILDYPSHSPRYYNPGPRCPQRRSVRRRPQYRGLLLSQERRWQQLHSERPAPQLRTPFATLRILTTSLIYS